MKKSLVLLAAAGVGLSAAPASAQCTGTCGTAAPNGVVTAPPAFGPNYNYVSTVNGINGVGQIDGVDGFNGSQFITNSFAGAVGDTLNFYFNYVTSDGTSGFPDYGFAELLLNGDSVGFLFTARTTPTGDTSPGFGLPSNISTLNPVSTPIIPGNGPGSTIGPVWSVLGSDSGQCFQGVTNGCGYTGWIGSTYSLTAAGNYQIRFGVTNVSDSGYDSGLAYAGITINDIPVDGAVPEPATWAMMIMGFGLIGAALRRQTVKAAFAA